MDTDKLALLGLIISSIALFAMVFGFRYLSNKENMAMIDRGMNPRLSNPSPVPFTNLKWGLLLMGAGLGLLVGYLVDVLMLPYVEHAEALYFAFIAIGGGSGLVICYRIERKELPVGERMAADPV